MFGSLVGLVYFPGFNAKFLDRAQPSYYFNTPPPPSLPPSLIDLIDQSGYYGVRIINGKIPEAGTHNLGVYVRFIGSEKATDRMHLIGIWEFLHGGMAKNTHMDFILKTDQNLGNIEVVILGIEGNMNHSSTWLVNSIIIYDCNTETEFPCYHWITTSEVAITAVTCKCISRR